VKYRVSEILPPARLTLLKISKSYETLGLHSLDIRLQMCVINFPLSRIIIFNFWKEKEITRC
jgi:hypothetical protein